MKLKQTLTTEVVSFKRASYRADLQVSLVNGEFSNLSSGVIYEGSTSLGLVNLIGGNSFELVEPYEPAKDFLLALRDEFCNYYNIALPAPMDEMPIPPENLQEEIITKEESGNINEIII